MATFEEQLKELLKRSESIRPQSFDLSSYYDPKNSENREEWINDVEIFYNKFLTKHALGNRINTIIFYRECDAFEKLVQCLKSISRDQDFLNEMNGVQTVSVLKYQSKTFPEYDLFLSHANRDKIDFVDNLYDSFVKLGINIFYDKDSLEWGDNWKDKILNGTQKSEFAVIVISENFFGREWTEKELSEFLNRQNRNGQKLILPILHNISFEQLQKHYPNVADIQALDSSKYSCDKIAVLFANQLIKKLKSI